ncbi:Bcr/CflA family efflux MFS transporter [Xenophilus sp. Marseille-Q4582]|uniref:Bcr/CflA family efflux MFS transporter n=1 Tax=Xenophilus sp. Marseille-Q4582 TaxID=2866600 RepID=UPI001CE4ADF9|nr:Bcr/CflA family efflux MFS transporter [Xenophilus sp. Marseille-Q4582]
MPPALVVLLLALLLGIQPVTTDLYLPTLPALTQALGGSVSQAQLTLTALLLAFGGAQLVFGALSDRFGRRPVLLMGMGAYVLAALATAAAPSIEVLIAARTVQGAAMGAAVMVARAMVRDLYPPTEGARVMSRALTGLGVIACLCAPLGGLVSGLWGWRAALLSTALFGSFAFALVALRFRETLGRPDPAALQPARLAATWAGMLRHPVFTSFTALTSAAYALLFTFLASSSFVFIEVLGLSKPAYGMVMLWNSLSYIGGTFLCRRWLPRHGIRGTVARAGALSLVGGALMGALALAGVQTVWAIVAPLTLVMLAHGVHQPCGQTGAIGPFPQAAGAASALNGFMQMVVAFGVGAWLGVALEDRSTKPLALGIAFWGGVLALLAWTVVRRHAGGPAAQGRTP